MSNFFKYVIFFKKWANVPRSPLNMHPYKNMADRQQAKLSSKQTKLIWARKKKKPNPKHCDVRYYGLLNYNDIYPEQSVREIIDLYVYLLMFQSFF